jgi:hypothetical protein
METAATAGDIAVPSAAVATPTATHLRRAFVELTI